MKAFPVAFDVNRICTLIYLDSRGQYIPSDSSRWGYRTHFPGSALIASEIYDFEIDIDNKQFIVWNSYCMESERQNLYLPFYDKALMDEFYTHFKKNLNMTKRDFELLMNL